MKRFLFVMFEGGGNVPVQLAIARRLVARGHEVRVLGDGAIEPEALAAGCSFAPFRHVPHHNFRSRTEDRVRDWSERNPIKKLQRIASALMFGPAEGYAREVLDELARWPADALAIDCLIFGAMIGAEASGLPTAQLHHTPYMWPLAGVPPVGLGLRPPRGWLARLGQRLLARFMVRAFEKLGRATVNAARITFGLPPLSSVFEQAQRQHRTLVLTARSFDFAAKVALPPHVTYVGAQLDDPGWAAPWRSPWPADAREPLVLVALGSTFQDQLGPIQRVVDALATLPVRGLVTLAGLFAPSELTLPPNVVAVASAPHREVMPHASVVVAHGGHGTVLKALSFGKPVLCIPLGRDQTENAVRVEVAGAGLQAKPSASPPKLRALLARLLDEPAFTAGARRLAEEIAVDVTEDRAVRELEALAAMGEERRKAAVA